MREKMFTQAGMSPPALAAAGRVLLAVVAVAVISGCGQQEASDTSTGNQGATGQTTTEATAGQTTASIGDKLTVGSVQWTVTNAEQQSQLYATKFGSDQGNFIIVELTFVNNSNQDITLATPFFILRDSQGREYEPDIDSNFKYLYPEENMFVDQVKPGATKEGKLIFKTDSDSSGFTLQVGEARFASKESGYIKLNV